MDKEIVSEKKDKPVLDEQTLAKLLEAAYVLQEHNRRMHQMELHVEEHQHALKPERSEAATPGSSPQTPSAGAGQPGDYTLTLAQIVETQHKIQLRQLKLDEAMALVAERVAEIARAGGAAIGILDGKKIRYRAAAGLMALAVGTEVSAEKTPCGSCMNTGHVFRCADVESEVLLDGAEYHRRGIQSLIAVPVFHEGGVAGGLELYYAAKQAFTEQDVHTCQLMAGLVTEALARNDEPTWKQSLASERVMLEALEKLKPKLAAKDAPAGKGSRSKNAVASTASPSPTYTCSKCGNDLVGEEQFCGKCGLPRDGGAEPPDFQSTLASLWPSQEATPSGIAAPPNGNVAHKASRPSTDHPHAESLLADSIEENMPELFALPEPADSNPLRSNDMFGSQTEDASHPNDALELNGGEPEEDRSSPGVALVKSDWSSAARARDFLEQLAGGNAGAFDRFWRARRGDIYLAIAVTLMALVVRWAIWSDHSVDATGTPTTAAEHKKTAPDADLPLLDRMLISLGLAEAPPPPEARGNPDTEVWVDLQTALYYCPGADLYGKTPKGKFATQHDAQLDQFEPAYRKACE